MSFVTRVLVMIGLVAAALLAWQLRQVVVLLFAGVVLAAIYVMVARWLRRWTDMGYRASVIAVVLVLLVATGGVIWFVGDALLSQMGNIQQAIPGALARVRLWLMQWDLGERLVSMWNDFWTGALASHMANWATLTLVALGELLLVVVMSIYMAIERDLYRNGMVRMVAPRMRSTWAEALDASGNALQGWMIGQLVSMVFVGVATGVGLALLGAPLPLALGLISGVFDFVPYFGPIAAGAIAVVLAFTDSPRMALYVLGVFLLVQQLETHVVVPLAQKWVVRLPPVLALIAVFVFGAIFGVVGVLLAAPAMVVCMVLVKRLYWDHYLESGKPAAQ